MLAKDINNYNYNIKRANQIHLSDKDIQEITQSPEFKKGAKKAVKAAKEDWAFLDK